MKRDLTIFKGTYGTLFYFLVRAAGTCFCRLDRAHALGLCRVLTRLFSRATRAQRLPNLRLFFEPRGFTEERIRAIDRGFTEYVARMGVDYLRLPITTPAQLVQSATMSGEEHVRAALEQGRGVVTVCGHFGGFAQTPMLLSARGFTTTVIYGEVPVPRVRKYLRELARLHHHRVTFVNDTAARDVGLALRRNELVCLAFDYRAGDTRGIELSFGPAHLRAHLAPAILALRHRSPVLYHSYAYQGDWRPHFAFHPETPLVDGKLTARAERLTADWVKLLVRDVEARPEQWLRWNNAALKPG